MRKLSLLLFGVMMLVMCPLTIAQEIHVKLWCPKGMKAVPFKLIAKDNSDDSETLELKSGPNGILTISPTELKDYRHRQFELRFQNGGNYGIYQLRMWSTSIQLNQPQDEEPPKYFTLQYLANTEGKCKNFYLRQKYWQLSSDH